MKPLLITATPNICWLQPDVPYPATLEALLEEARQCEAAGAAIYHIHAEGRWAETILTLRAETEMIIQAGMSSLKIPERAEVFEAPADMISIITSHHDEAFAEVDVHELHPREELLEYARLSNRHKVKLEFEVWHTGSIWNLNYLISQDVVTAPYFTTLFFGWPGGSWTPPTIEEYLHRRRYMPANCIISTSVMGQEQIEILAAAIVSGDHVRVGTEDYPYNHTGEIASTHELVAEIAHLSKSVGRPVATPTQARQMLGLSERPVVSSEVHRMARGEASSRV